MGTIQMIWIFGVISLAIAQNSPFIDSLKKTTEIDANDLHSYTEAIKQKLQEKQPHTLESSYTEKIRKELSIEESSEGFSEVRKSELEKIEIENSAYSKNQMGAIEAVQKGQSELRLVRSTEIHSALGFRVGASVTRSYTGQSIAFSTVYPSTFSPDFTIHYEWKPFHSEWFGSLGIVAEAGIQTFRGFGIFKFQLTNPVTGDAFSTTSRTSTQLMAFPVMSGAVYRFNLLQFLRPYLQVGPMALVMFETRSDTDRVLRSLSVGWYGSAGLSLLLDGLDKEKTWELYSTHGVKHFYLTGEYFLAQPLFGDVAINSQGIYLGLLLEM